MMSKQEKKEDLKAQADKIKEKIKEIYGDHVREIDFSYVDLFTVLFYHEMRHDPQDPAWLGRDRLVISNLKVLPSLFAVLAEIGYMNWKEFQDLIVMMPRIFSNPNISLINYPGVEFITDSPYSAMLLSIGSALTGANSRQEFRAYHITTDRRTAQLQNTLMAASAAKMSNITSIIPFLDLPKKTASAHFWFSMGWQIEEAKFDDISSIYEGLARTSKSKEKPQVLLG